jgi:drug/metabolite transporter (DMT)-like permease
MTFSFCCSVILHWKNLTSNAPPLLIIANQEFIVFLTGVLFTFKQGDGNLYKSHLKIYFKRVLLMSFVVFLAILFNFIGLKETNPIITSLLFLATPLTIILFSAFFFKEKLSYKNIFFISIIVIGAFALHYQSNKLVFSINNGSVFNNLLVYIQAPTP